MVNFCALLFSLPINWFFFTKRIKCFARANSNKALSVLIIKEDTACLGMERVVVVAGHRKGQNGAGVRRSWMECEESAQGYRGKRNERGEERMSKPGEVCILLGLYHDSWHSGPVCLLALCSFLGLVRNQWVKRSRDNCGLRSYWAVSGLTPLLPGTSLQACLGPLAPKTYVFAANMQLRMAGLTSSVEGKQGNGGYL